MQWIIEAYITDTLNYLVYRQSDQDWYLLFNGKVLGEFPDQGSAIAYAEVLNQQNTIGSPPG